MLLSMKETHASSPHHICFLSWERKLALSPCPNLHVMSGHASSFSPFSPSFFAVLINNCNSLSDDQFGMGLRDAGACDYFQRRVVPPFAPLYLHCDICHTVAIANASSASSWTDLQGLHWDALDALEVVILKAVPIRCFWIHFLATIPRLNFNFACNQSAAAAHGHLQRVL